MIFTLGLFHAGRDGAQKVVGSEKHLNVVALLDANRGKIPEYFVGRGIRANAILVFDNLGMYGSDVRRPRKWDCE